MVLFFKTPEQQIIAVDVMHELSAREVECRGNYAEHGA